MANSSLNDLVNLMNQQIESREILSEYLSKAEALAQVTLSKDFFDFQILILYYYLWVLSDIIKHARILNEQSLNELLKQRPLPVK